MCHSCHHTRSSKEVECQSAKSLRWSNSADYEHVVPFDTRFRRPPYVSIKSSDTHRRVLQVNGSQMTRMTTRALQGKYYKLKGNG